VVYEGVDGISYFAKLNADTSAIETMTPDEYKAEVAQCRVKIEQTPPGGNAV
jgi:hypothetical protein